MIGMDKVLLASRGSAGEPAAEGVSFDGVSDYLSRSSDLVGNIDSKTFTFSVWVYRTSVGTNYIYDSSLGGAYGLEVISLGSTNQIIFNTKDASGNVVRFVTPASSFPVHTKVHLLVSVDSSDTNKRHVYINDAPVSVSWQTYANRSVDFTTPASHIAKGTSAPTALKGRLSHLFLDYQYRDLSIEANRRLFSVEV